MARIPFGLLDEPETRQPSKVRLAFLALFLLLLSLSVVFITLYALEKSKSKDSSDNRSQQTDNKVKTTNLPFKKIKPTHLSFKKVKTTHLPFEKTRTTSENIKTSNSPTAEIKTTEHLPTCTSSACLTSAEILSKLDQSVDPCDDFYQYSCGGFLNKTHLKDDQPQLDSFTVAFDAIQNALKEILQDEGLWSRSSEDSAVYKTLAYYKSCMNQNSIKNVGTKSILEQIEQHGSWNITNKDWTGDSWKLEKILARVLVDLNTPAFLSWSIGADFFDTSKSYITISAGSSAFDRLWLKEKSRDRSRLPQKYIQAEDSEKEENYKVFISTIFKLLGADSNVDEEVNRIVGLEKEFKNIKEYITDIEELKKNVKFMTVYELNAYTSYKFDWQAYFDEILSNSFETIPSYKTLMVVFPDNIKKIVDWLHDKPKSLLANEIMWHVVRGLVDLLPLEFQQAEDKYRKDTTGFTFPRWQTCNILTDGLFRFVTTLLYANKHLSEDARTTAQNMFDEIKSQFINGLSEQTWMDYSTREQARLKLQKMTDLIGYPTLIKRPGILDLVYEKFEVDQYHLFRNTLNIYKLGFENLIKKVGKTDGIEEVDSISSLTYLSINAFYSPGGNSMTVLAGILQPPFYKHDRLKALNYGSLGMVVGHEITHGFDKQGSEYDEKGNIRQWWTSYSHKNFVERSTCLIEEYNKVKIFGYQVNGNKTLSENIADNGGLKYAYRAYKNWRETYGEEEQLPGLSFNSDQLFFVGFAQVWCSKYTKKFAKILMDEDVHSLNPVRVRVPLHNYPEFSKAFGCKPRNNTCTVW